MKTNEIFLFRCFLFLVPLFVIGLICGVAKPTRADCVIEITEISKHATAEKSVQNGPWAPLAVGDRFHICDRIRVHGAPGGYAGYVKWKVVALFGQECCPNRGTVRGSGWFPNRWTTKHMHEKRGGGKQYLLPGTFSYLFDGEEMICEGEVCYDSGHCGSMTEVAEGVPSDTAPPGEVSCYKVIYDSVTHTAHFLNYPYSYSRIGTRARVGPDTLSIIYLNPGKHIEYHSDGSYRFVTVAVFPEEEARGNPGGVAIAHFTLVNGGAMTDQIQVQVREQLGWPITPTSLLVTLDPGEDTIVSISVSIPPNQPDDYNTLTLSAVSLFDPTQADSNSLLVFSSTVIPTLTEWGLIIFGVVLLGFITYVFLRRRKAVVSLR